MKKLTALLLTLIMVVGIASVGFAAPVDTNPPSTARITDVIKAIDVNASYDLSSGEPGKVWYFPLTADMFEWSNGVEYSSKVKVTTSQISNSSVSYRTSGLDSKVIKNVSIVNRNSQAQVKVEFVSEFISTKEIDYTTSIFLSVKNNRKEASRIVLDGTFANPEKSINSNSDYEDISKGIVLAPTEYIRDIELFLGDGILMRTRLYGNQKYYGTASRDESVNDSNILNTYRSIEAIIRLNTVNLKSSGNIVEFDGWQGYHVYDSSGKYLGEAGTNVLFPYSDRYYLSTEKINMGGGTSTSSSSTSSSSTASSSSTSSGGTTATGSAISAATAKSQTQAAINTAKAGGAKTVSVRFKDASSISAAALTEMRSLASSNGMTVNLVADTMNGTAVNGRITINAANTANITSDVKLGVYTDADSVAPVKAKFDKWFKNRMIYVALGQQSSYGATVKIAVKVNLSSLNTNNLVFYTYNASTNKYSQITNPNYTIDSSGYLHFNTVNAGYIIITDSALAKA